MMAPVYLYSSDKDFRQGVNCCRHVIHCLHYVVSSRMQSLSLNEVRNIVHQLEASVIGY